jgi:hypothetical protein
MRPDFPLAARTQARPRSQGLLGEVRVHPIPAQQGPKWGSLSHRHGSLTLPLGGVAVPLLTR